MSWYNPTTWFGSTQAVEKTADNLFDKDNGLLSQVGGWVGNMAFTDEEQAELHFKIAEKAGEFVGNTLNESTVRSKTRRRVAIMWIQVQLALIIMVAIWIPFDTDIASKYLDLATSDVMTWGTGSIIVFFFGGYVWGAYVKKRTAT